MGQDWIEREVVIDASRERVWTVLTQADEVARWFGDSAEIDLRPGGAARFGWRAHGVFRAIIERVEPPGEFSYRWARDTETDPAEGTATQVEFTLTEVPLGTLLRVVEDLPGRPEAGQLLDDEHGRTARVRAGADRVVGGEVLRQRGRPRRPVPAGV